MQFQRTIITLIVILSLVSNHVRADLHETSSSTTLQNINYESQVGLVSIEEKQDETTTTQSNIFEWVKSLFSRETFVTTVKPSSCTVINSYRDTEKFGDKANKNTVYGCNEGEYVRLVACYDKAGTSCEPIFADLWYMSSGSDKLKIFSACRDDGDSIINCNQRDWFKDFVYNKYVGYDCMNCPSPSTAPTECKDGTLIGQCSSNKPKECVKVWSSVLQDYKVFLTDSCSECGCPSGLKCDKEIDACASQIPPNSCSYGGKYYTGTICSSMGTGVYECRYPSNFYLHDCKNPCTPYQINPSCTPKQPEYYCNICGNDGCVKGGPYTSPCEEECSLDKDCQHTCTVCEDNKCVEKIFNYHCSNTCETDSDCSGNEEKPKSYDTLIPTIHNVEMLTLPGTLDKSGGGVIPLRITLRVPLGVSLRDLPDHFRQEYYDKGFWANLITSPPTDEDFKIEIGIYKREWAEKQGWIQDINLLTNRAFRVYALEAPCQETQKDFINAYSINDNALVGALGKCTTSSVGKLQYDSSLGACIVTLDTARDWYYGKEEQIFARVPTSASYVQSTKNYDPNGEYIMVVGLYYICGEYFNNPNSLVKIELQVGEPVPQTPGTPCTGEGDSKKVTCSDGTTILRQSCMQNEDGDWVWGDVIDSSCPESESKLKSAATQISMTESDLKEATPEMILGSVCAVTENCLPYEPITDEEGVEYTVECKSTEIIKQKITEAAKSKCSSFGTVGKYVALLAPSVTCGLAILGTAASGGIAAPTMIACVLQGVVLGTGVETLALASEAACVMYKTGYAKGLCIATPHSTASWCKYTEPFGIFKITGDKCQDGLVIIIGAILLLFLLPKLFGR